MAAFVLGRDLRGYGKEKPSGKICDCGREEEYIEMGCQSTPV